jgi:hypothetical protein
MTLAEAQAIAAAGIRSGLIRARRPYCRRNVPVRRADYPAGPAGQWQYNTEYQRAKRRQDGLTPRIREVPVSRLAYPKTQEGTRAYNHDYQAAYRKLRNQ